MGLPMSLDFKIDGDMDAHSMPSLRAAFEELADKQTDVVLDFSDVKFLDSSGIGGIVFLFKRLTAAGKKLSLTKVSGQPMRLLTHLGMTPILINTPAMSLA
jgi:anti-sigma B factor antagonist